MIRIILAFAVVFSCFYFGIEAFRNMTGKERWSLTKTVSYSILCAVLTIVALSLFVVAF